MNHTMLPQGGSVSHNVLICSENNCVWSLKCQLLMKQLILRQKSMLIEYVIHIKEIY